MKLKGQKDFRGDDTVTSGLYQGKVRINTGGGDDNISVDSEAATNKINCGGGEDTVITATDATLDISKNCENVIVNEDPQEPGPGSLIYTRVILLVMLKFT